MGGIFIYYFDFLSVGIDVASKISWARIVRPDHKPIGKPIKIDHQSIESLEFLVDEIKKAEEQNDLKARILLESTGVYHIPLYYYLKESGFEVLILNPLITDSNKNQGIRKVKSDKTDALRIAKTAFTYELKQSLIPSEVVLNIRSLIRDYHKYADLKTQHVNKLIKALCLVFPQYPSVFSHVTGKTALAILEVYKTPQNILSISRVELVDFIAKTSRTGLDASNKTYEKLISAAKLALTFSHQLDASYFAVQMEIEMIRIFESKKEKLLDRVLAHMAENEEERFVQEIELLQTIPGIGFISAVSIMSEIGDFSAFDKPKQLVAYFGLDPVVKESGNFKATQTRLSKRGSRIARRVLFRVVLACIRKKRNGEATNPVLRAYYDQKLISKAKKTAIGAIMRKVTNIVFAVLRDQQPFVLKTATQHIQEHNKALGIAA